VARIEPFEVTYHGDLRTDNYHWLEDPDDPEVIAYLEAENAYTQAVMAHTQPLQEVLYRELSERVSKDEVIAPRREGDYFYYYRWEEGKGYPVYARKRGSLEAEEETLLDVNLLAEGHEFTWVWFPVISPDQSIMAFAVDTVVGIRGHAMIGFRDLDTGQLLPDTIDPSGVQMAWASDNRTLFYIGLDPSGRGPALYRHVLGTDTSEDGLVLERVTPPLRKIDGYILIESEGNYLFLDADQPDREFDTLVSVRPGEEYDFASVGGFFYIRTNEGEAPNSRLVRTPVTSPGKENWEEVIPHRADVLLEGFDLFRDYLVLQEREGGLVNMRVRPWAGGSDYSVEFGEPVYEVYVNAGDFDSNLLRYEYSSFKTPRSVYEYNLDTREEDLLWREEVFGGFDPAEYVSERRFAPAPDGTLIPVSILYRRGLERNGEHPLLLYGYGGATVEPAFDADLFSLVDRGFSYAIAHVRGGRELGIEWEKGGQGRNSHNRVTDFIAVAEFLVHEGYTSTDRLFAHGISSGGGLVGGVSNMRPELFKGIVAQVPLMDVVSPFMASPRPMEAGDPREEADYRYVMSLSPYQNIEAKEYPSMLVTTALLDTQAPYWIPTKWVAKLRALKTGENILLLKANLGAQGHAGSTDRLENWRETAFLYAFILDLVEIDQ
jgi:oligopeptidase B